MSLQRLETRDHLILSLGYLLDPLRRVLFREPFVSMTRPEQIRFTRALDLDLGYWRRDLETFAEYNDLFFDHECTCAKHFVDEACKIIRIRYSEKDQDRIAVQRVLFNQNIASAIGFIRSIPVEIPDMILPARSPFQSYRLFRSLCSNACKRIEIFDAYLDEAVFHRYLSDLQPDVDVKLVTDETYMGPTNNRRQEAIRDRIVAVSELLAQERPGHYWFLVVPSLHDRHLRVDDDLFHLGGSLKDAAKNDPFTFVKLDSTDAASSVLDDYISSATPWYQPGFPRHRRWCLGCTRPSDVQANRACSTCSTLT